MNLLGSIKRKIFELIDKYVFAFGVFLLTLTLAWTLVSPKEEVLEKKQEVMVKPDDYRKHLDLAKGFLEVNNYEAAKREFDLAVSLRQAPLESGDNQILGEESVWENLKRRILEPERLNEEIEKWEKIVDERNNYRDGYLKLAILFWRVGKEEEAKENLNKALDLDPNYDLALELKGIIK